VRRRRFEPGQLLYALNILAPKGFPVDNMKLWNEAFVTDPRAVKPITGKQYKGNSPKPFWIIQRATEIFGPVGIGWGVTVKSERFEKLGEHDVLHVAVVSVWYVWDGQRGETFDQMGGTKAAYMTSKGSLMVDEDAGKKSVTDGMVKCLSMIGFAGDIFSGMWDDSKYVQWAGEETRRRESPQQEEAPPVPEKKRGQSTLAAAVEDNPIPEDEKPYLDELAMDMTEAFQKDGAEAAYALMADKELDNGHKLYLSTRLASNVRNAVKKVSMERRAVAA
jgi:hypothetical protein